jgi:hypothetical protein
MTGLEFTSEAAKQLEKVYLARDIVAITPVTRSRQSSISNAQMLVRTCRAVRRRLLLRVKRTCRSSEPTSDFDPLQTWTPYTILVVSTANSR